MQVPVAPEVLAAELGVRQPGLWAGEEPVVDPTFAGATRRQLDETSWVEHVPGWLTGSDRLFDELLATAPFERRDRWMYDRRVVEPRLTAEYPDVADAPVAALGRIVEVLRARYGAAYRSLWINLYRDHRDSTAWHGDGIGRVQERSTVPVLSLGATRRFVLRPLAGGPSVALEPAAGDLVVMGGRCQRDWRHCVPKQARAAGPRMSVNFSPERT